MLQDLSDDALVQRCRQGEQAAWSTLVRRFQRLIYTIPRRAGLSDDQAADVFQISFQRLHEHLDRIEDASRVRAWLVTTAKRETLRLLQEARRFVALAGSGGDDEDADPLAAVPDPAPLQDAQLSALQESHRLREAVDRLDPPARQLVELLFLQEEPLPYAEIARRLGIPEGSIGPTRARCLAKLRNVLQKV
ncbi:MAG TPA: sigma-70 family RNA polymerase sigma factor [Rubrivivax sp.]|nr:sigma-70 family RNA polymerase sigma factor [Rubrivivax sp.]